MNRYKGIQKPGNIKYVGTFKIFFHYFNLFKWLFDSLKTKIIYCSVYITYRSKINKNYTNAGRGETDISSCMVLY